LQHDPARRVDSRVLKVEVVDLPDGFKAVEAEYDVDAETWRAFQQEVLDQGAPGGMSFSCSEPLVDLTPHNPGTTVQLGLYADAAHFSDDTLVAAGEALAEVGAVQVGRLLQFSYFPACRIIVEYVHQSGGLSPAMAGVTIGLNLVSSAIFEAVRRLLSRRQPVSGTAEQAPQIEVHLIDEPGGVTVQTLKIVASDEETIRQALDRFIEPAEHPDWGVVVWDPDASTWRPA
jgi:hypothetical protein